MAVHPQRSTWTDERLDDLLQVMRDGFARNDAEHLAMRQEMREGFEQVDRRFERMEDRMDQRFDQLASRVDSLQLALIIGMIGLIATMIATSYFG
jgi:hypothetical protein